MKTKNKYFGFDLGDPILRQRDLIKVQCPNCGRFRDDKAENYEQVCMKCENFKVLKKPLNNIMSTSISRFIHEKKGGRRWQDLTGYSLDKLIEHLESEFEEGMSWDNYGKLWHIDHYIPLSKFEFESFEDLQFKKAWGLSNLRPLRADLNMKKSDHWVFY